MKSLPLLILLLTALPTLARLGETRAQCEARYGKPVGTTDLGRTLYRKAGLEIAIHFWKDKAARLYIAKDKPGAPDPDTLDIEPGERAPLSDTEIKTLLKASSANSEWKLLKDGEGDPFADLSWERSDHKADAAYIQDRLELHDTIACKEIDEDIKKQEADKLKAFGGFGETREECDKRYGKPEKIIGDELHYQKSGIGIIITLWKGKAASITFHPEPLADFPDHPAFFLEKEQAAILEANAAGSKWVEDESNDDPHTMWRRADGTAVALYSDNDTGDFLIIESRDYTRNRIQERDEETRKAEAEEAKELDGF